MIRTLRIFLPKTDSSNSEDHLPSLLPLLLLHHHLLLLLLLLFPIHLQLKRLSRPAPPKTNAKTNSKSNSGWIEIKQKYNPSSTSHNLNPLKQSTLLTQPPQPSLIPC